MLVVGVCLYEGFPLLVVPLAEHNMYCSTSVTRAASSVRMTSQVQTHVKQLKSLTSGRGGGHDVCVPTDLYDSLVDAVGKSSIKYLSL